MGGSLTEFDVASGNDRMLLYHAATAIIA